MGNGARLMVFVLATALVAACSPDPYNLHPQSYKVESAVMGQVALDMQEPREGSGDYVLMEGIPYYDGGIVWRAFYLTDIEVTPKVGDAIRQRKSRFGEIFGMLSRGVVGETADNTIVPRVSIAELTQAEKKLLADENRDREIIVAAFAKGKKVVAAEMDAVRRVNAFARYQLMPPGVWVEKEPGEWIVKGGRDYRSRVMARDPIEVRQAPASTAPPEAAAEQPGGSRVLLTPQPRTR